MSRVIGTVLAIVTCEGDRCSGGAPIFYAEDPEEQREIAFLLSRLTHGAVHELPNKVLVIVGH